MKRAACLAPESERRKAMGVHYTPADLARFIADHIVAQIGDEGSGVRRILDPACGDGVLLEAVLASLHDAGKLGRCEVVGVEADQSAIRQVEARCARFEGVSLRLVEDDFLNLITGHREQGTLWDHDSSDSTFLSAFDIVIANPPYVRTQVMGADKAQRLADRYGLSGRVDLYQVFLVAVTQTLKPGGWIGIITSNRFLSTLGGSAIRGYLAGNYEIHEVIDLGDTKLFEAAVLPAVLVARRGARQPTTRAQTTPRFLKVYSEANPAADQSANTSPRIETLDILRQAKPGVYQTAGGTYRLTTGDLLLGRDPRGVWRLTTHDETGWLNDLRSSAAGCFGDVAAVHVGIKTTADSVFIRTDWEALPESVRPEPELLRPLLQHEDACRWSLAHGTVPAGRVLYPHRVIEGRRCAIDLDRYPGAKGYLEQNRERLERRRYLIDAGRNWFEIWVPQDPEGWACPKIVFPDISPGPKFYLDDVGQLVGGDCYWMTLRPGVAGDAIFLILAVANSSLATRFHDLAFNNKLYSARRRYITQYVTQYPLPDVRLPVSREIMTLTKQICEETRRQVKWAEHPLSVEVDRLVHSVFGLDPQEAECSDMIGYGESRTGLRASSAPWSPEL